MNPTQQALGRIENKVDRNHKAIAAVSLDLAVHKAKTSKLSLLLGGIASVLVALSAMLLKGCV